jgi:phosphohistidine phosphatase
MMRLYLVRHGEAVPKAVDPECPLSERGRAEVEQVASFLGEAGVRVVAVLHSGKRRAEQTAELLASSVGNRPRLEKISGIAPLDPTNELARIANAWTEDTMVVGHLPFMARLVSRLVTGDEADSAVAYHPGSVVCLERWGDARWTIAWMLRPELLLRTP